MPSILDIIVANKRLEVDAKEKAGIYSSLPPRRRQHISMSAALNGSSSGIIAEFKRRSPSRGEIAPMASCQEIISGYVTHGATACSILTDTRFFGGSLADLAVAATVAGSTPLLRKEFIINESQILESNSYGADAILLIASILTADQLQQFTDYAHHLGLEVLVELHSPSELHKLPATADMVGINNRDLNSFNTDTSTSSLMASLLPENIVKVAESGINSATQIRDLRSNGYRGFLMGEAFMSTPHPHLTLQNIITELYPLS